MIENEIELYTEDSDNPISTDKDEVRIQLDNILNKIGKKYSNNIIEWKVEISSDILRQGEIVTITDDFQNQNLQLREDSLKLTYGEEEIVFDLKEVSDGKFRAEFTHVDKSIKDQKYVLSYKTEIKGNISNRYSNGVGISIGDSEYKTNAVVDNGTEIWKLGLNNSDKSIKIDYLNEEITWKIRVITKTGDISKLKIEDNFINENNPSNLNFQKMEYKENSMIIKNFNSDITEKFDISRRDNGFSLELKDKESIKSDSLGNNDIEITYKTSFNLKDLDDLGHKKFYNSASIILSDGRKDSFGGKVTAETEDINSWIYDNGIKQGNMSSENIKNINWQLRINPNGKNIDNKLIVDKIAEDDRHRFIEENLEFKAYEYSLDKNGNLVWGEEIKDTINVDIKDNGKKLEIRLGEDLKNKSIYIEYNTTRYGMAQKEYRNNVIVNNKEYPGMVGYNKNLVEKNIINSKNKIYNGDMIQWKVKINENRSEFDKLEIVDVVSEGLIYKGDTLLLKDITNNSELVLGKDYELEYFKVEKDVNDNLNIIEKVSNISDANMFSIKILVPENIKLIDNEYELTYETEVSIKNYHKNIDKIFNEILINGKKVLDEEQSRVELRVSAWSSIEEEWEYRKKNNAKIVINKLDSVNKFKITNIDNEALKAKFELYKYLGQDSDNKDSWEFIDIFETEDGSIDLIQSIGKYKLVEIKAPEGYMLDPTPYYIEVVSREDNNTSVDSNTTVVKLGETANLDIENKKIADYLVLNIIKKDKDTKEVLKGVKFDLYAVDESKEDSQKLIKTNLVVGEEDRIEIKDLALGSYELKEVEALPNYQELKDSIKFEVVENEDGSIEITIINTDMYQLKLNDNTEETLEKSYNLTVYNKKNEIGKPVDPVEPVKPVDPDEEGPTPSIPDIVGKPKDKDEGPKEEPKTEIEPEDPKNPSDSEEPKEPKEELTEEELLALAEEEARRKEEQRRIEEELLALAEEEAKRQEEQRRKEELAKAKKLLKTGSKNNIGYMAAGISLIGLGAALGFKKKDK